MGTCIDYAFRFGGLNQAKVNLALQYIRDVQKENAEFSGNGVCDFSGDPRDDEAFKLWSCYTKAGDETPLLLRLKLIDRKRSINYTLSVRREIWNAGVHANKVDTCDGERFRSIEWLGAWTPARWTLPL